MTGGQLTQPGHIASLRFYFAYSERPKIQKARFEPGPPYPDFLCAYAAFFDCCALTRAHLALAAAAIRFLPAAEILRNPEFSDLPFAFGDCFLNFAHLALWA